MAITYITLHGNVCIVMVMLWIVVSVGVVIMHDLLWTYRCVGDSVVLYHTNNAVHHTITTLTP